MGIHPEGPESEIKVKNHQLRVVRHPIQKVSRDVVSVVPKEGQFLGSLTVRGCLSLLKTYKQKHDVSNSLRTLITLCLSADNKDVLCGFSGGLPRTQVAPVFLSHSASLSLSFGAYALTLSAWVTQSNSASETSFSPL